MPSTPMPSIFFAKSIQFSLETALMLAIIGIFKASFSFFSLNRCSSGPIFLISGKIGWPISVLCSRGLSYGRFLSAYS